MRPIVCIRHEPSAPLGIIAAELHRRRVPWRYVECWRGDGIPDVTEVSALIVLGGAMNADEVDSYPWLAPTRRLMRAAVDHDVPLLGVCLGAQLLARAMDAPVVRAPVREIGFRKVEVLPAGSEDPLLRAFAPSSLVFEFHEDTCRLPDGAQLLATNDDGGVQAFRVGERAYGVQFHFEVTENEIAAWCDETTPGVMRDVWHASKAELLAEAQTHLAAQQQQGRALTAAFIDLMR